MLQIALKHITGLIALLSGNFLVMLAIDKVWRLAGGTGFHEWNFVFSAGIQVGIIIALWVSAMIDYHDEQKPVTGATIRLRGPYE